MELRQLKYFVKVAELLSFSKASKALYITQSTLSQQIKQLEDELNAPLLNRNSHNVELTEAGEVFLKDARKVMAEAEDCKARILDLNKGYSGHLNIGVTHSFGSILTETVMAFKKEYPNVLLNIRYKTVSELMELLSDLSLPHPRTVSIAIGASAYPMIKRLRDMICDTKNITVNVYKIINNF